MKRFKIFLVTTFLISFSSSFTFAQFSSIGIKAGLNLSKLDSENHYGNYVNYGNSYRSGMNIGLFTEINSSDNFLMHAEIIYSMRGSEFIIEENNLPTYAPFPHKVIYKLDYLEIPLLFQYSFLTQSRILPKIFLGPVVSFILNSKIETFDEDNSLGEYDNNRIKSTEFGIIIGVGADYNLSPGKIIIDMRYQYGLTNLNEVDQIPNIKSNTISFNVGYGMAL